jgi:signal transduction histidine kinase
VLSTQFSIQKTVPPERLEIRIMQERADSIGGKVAIQSAKNQGTAVIIDIPLPGRI